MLTEPLISPETSSPPTGPLIEPSQDAASQTKATSDAWLRLCQGFLRCHRQPLNVALHCVTTPLGWFGVFALVQTFGDKTLLVAAAGLAASIACFVPLTTAFASAAVIGFLALGSYTLAVGWIWGLVALLVGFFGQELSHWLTGEVTYQSTYKTSSSWWRKWLEHTVLLIPALLVVSSRSRQSPLRLLVARCAVLKTKLTRESQRADFADIVRWVRREQPTVTSSTHWWQHDLSEAEGEAFERLATDGDLIRLISSFHGPGFRVEPVRGMNEIYVTGPMKKHSSDTVFYMGHVDGPWAVFPGATVYRCMLALNANREVTTHYPMSTPEGHAPESHRLEHGDAVAFDFNRELHYITRETHPEQTEPRINLKLHFVAYPASVPWYGRSLAKLTTLYDIKARKLFLGTIDPNNWWASIKTRWVLMWTRVFEWIVQSVGWSNLAYTVAAFGAAALFGSGSVALALLSFVHYGIYVGTLAERGPVSFGTFVRNAMFFKSVSMLLLIGTFCWALTTAGESMTTSLLKCVPVVVGFGLAAYASRVLGMNRTLFSAELGFDSNERSARFPFGTIPHPMILGAVTAIGSMLLVNPMREQFTWLIVGHLVCYAVVLGQEIVHTRRFARARN